MTAGSGQYYRSLSGDVLDAIVHRHYGESTSATLWLVFDANPGLAAFGPTLPEGLEIFLPDSEPAPEPEAPRLW